MKLIYIHILFACIFFLPSCNKPNAPDCFQKAGDRMSIERMLDQDVISIESNDQLDLKIVPSELQKIIIEGPSNLLPEIITNVDSQGRLILKNDNTCNFVRNLSPNFQLTLYAKPESIVKLGSGDLNFADTLHVDQFSLICDDSSGDCDVLINCQKAEISVPAGLSKVKVQGKCFELNAFNQGINRMDCSGLDSRFTALVSNSINTLSGRSSEYLYVNLQSTGDILYHGNPNTIDVEGEGDGELLFVSD